MTQQTNIPVGQEITAEQVNTAASVLDQAVSTLDANRVVHDRLRTASSVVVRYVNQSEAKITSLQKQVDELTAQLEDVDIDSVEDVSN